MHAITSADIPAVARFLHSELNRRLSPSTWAAAIRPTWPVEAPNHGFMLVARDEIVGVQVAIYSDRDVDGETERFCNLAAWCVKPEHRAQGLRLLSAVLAQKGYTFTDLSPSGSVVPLNRRLKFESLDTGGRMVFNLPWPVFDRRVRILSETAAIEATLRGRDLGIFRDHVNAAAAHHLVIERGRESCYLIFRRDRRKGRPLFASILHVSNPALFQETCSHVFSHLLLRHGIVVTLVEERIAHCRPWHATGLPAPRAKMFRSSKLRDVEIDYLYSELVCVPW